MPEPVPSDRGSNERYVPGGNTLCERVLLELARRDKSNIRETFEAITEAAAVVLCVTRVSIWQLVEDGDDDSRDARLVCKDLYLLNEQRHASFRPIYASDFPNYLRAIRERRILTVNDARTDPNTREFVSFYLEPLGITSMMDVPIWYQGRMYGVLCLEHVGRPRCWQLEEQAFAINMTDIAAAALEAADHKAVRRRWEMVIQRLDEAVAVMNGNGRFVEANPIAERLLGSVTGQTFEQQHDTLEYFDMTDRIVPIEDWPLRRIMRGDILKGEIFGVVRKTTGERHFIQITSSRITEEGLLRYAIIIANDVTQEIMIERLKREMISRLAHEFKTSLAIAKGYAQQLASARDRSDSETYMLDAIARACNRMDNLSEALLDLASIFFGRLRLTCERVDLAALTHAVAHRIEHDDRSLTIVVDSEPGTYVFADSVRISQVLRQVLKNAAASSKTGPKPVVTIRVYRRQDKAIVSVHDDGSEIASDVRESLFSLAGPIATTGLGSCLYLAREIVRQHGGDLWLTSDSGAGNTYYLELPVPEIA